MGMFTKENFSRYMNKVKYWLVDLFTKTKEKAIAVVNSDEKSAPYLQPSTNIVTNKETTQPTGEPPIMPKFNEKQGQTRRVHQMEEKAANAPKVLAQTEKKQAPGFALGMPKWDVSRRPLTVVEAGARSDAYVYFKQGGPTGSGSDPTQSWADYSGEDFRK